MALVSGASGNGSSIKIKQWLGKLIKCFCSHAYLEQQSKFGQFKHFILAFWMHLFYPQLKQ